jgi:1-acyl-sn-glycerol-3-phosphate acyltransferase
LAIKEKMPVLPICIKGTREAIPKGSWIFKASVSASLSVLEPIETAHFAPSDFAKLKEIVFERILSEGRA